MTDRVTVNRLSFSNFMFFFGGGVFFNFCEFNWITNFYDTGIMCLLQTFNGKYEKLDVS